MTQIHMRSTEFGFHVRNPIPLTLGSQFSRKNLKDLIHLILNLFPNQADHLVNKLFGVDLSTHRPIHPDTSEKGTDPRWLGGCGVHHIFAEASTNI